MRCNGTWAFEQGDSYTIVAINALDPRLDDGSWDKPNLQVSALFSTLSLPLSLSLFKVFCLRH